jgi:unspecific monooxygenase
VEVAGVLVEEGEKIAALLGAANRDPSVFTDADVFDPARDPNPHLAFGAGVHFCLGAPLARMELAESLAALFAAYPDLHLVGEPRSRGTFVLRGYAEVRVSGRVSGRVKQQGAGSAG